ncbi:12831_t:CDS:2 [Gigaspora rosea]|nr:12831_t:CDS:2 [Gigaspora rosea]
MDIGNEKNVNWWCSPINEPIIPFILSIIYFIIFGFFIISLKIQIKNAIQTREFENTPNKSPENNLVDSENESERLQVTEIKKITSYISIIWVQFVMFIYTITQLARADSIDILILFQYIRYESLIHGQNQSKIPKFVINQAPTKNSNDSPINTTKNWFLGQFHSNKHLTFSSINSSFSSSRESYTSFRDSFRDSIQKFKLPFTKIQVQVVQHQISESSDSYSDSGSDGHIRLEIPTINNNISKNS